MNQQVDSVSRCNGCGCIIHHSATIKVNHHKRVGPYKAPALCPQCQREGEAPKRVGPPPPKPPTLSSPLDPTTNHVLPIAPYDSLSHYRRQHYGKHIPGNPYSRIGERTAGGRVITATTLVDDKADASELYAAASEIARRTDSDIYQYTDGDVVVKLTITNDTHVELTIFRPIGDGQYEFVTSYGGILLSVVQAKVACGQWRWS